MLEKKGRNDTPSNQQPNPSNLKDGSLPARPQSPEPRRLPEPHDIRPHSQAFQKVNGRATPAQNKRTLLARNTYGDISILPNRRLLSDYTSHQRELARKIALEVVKSLGVNDGMTRLTIPAGIGDLLAMRALNISLRGRSTKDGRDAISEEDIAFYGTLSDVRGRNINEPRHIWIQPIVPGTERASRREQEQVLKSLNMVFADPLSVALVAGAHAYAHNRADVLRKLWVRTEETHMAIATDKEVGIVRVTCPNGLCAFPVAAAGMFDLGKKPR